MAIWPLNRKKNKPVLPKEVQDYYQAEKRERVGVAGLLAAVTLIVTVLLALGLFFAGRWAYRSVVKNDDKSNTTQTEQTGTIDDSAAKQTVAKPDQASTPTTQNQTPTPTPSTTPSNTGVATVNSSDLPNTGPTSTLIIVIGSMILSSTAFYLIRRPL